MKLGTTKPPLCSPSRAVATPAKFPPPLMRFLRSNAGSKSRGGVRSRASPIFYRRTRKPLTAPPTQEPSSPKVNCMGQVRVRRAVKSRHRLSWWLNFKRVLFSCPTFTDRKMPIGNVFRNWGFCTRSGYCNKVDEGIENSFRIYSNGRRRNVIESDNNSESGALVQSSSSPPKNALILMRCRSAPYRSTSLAGRFYSENDNIFEEPQKPTTPENESSEESIEESTKKANCDPPITANEMQIRASKNRGKTQPRNQHIQTKVRKLINSILN